MLKGFLSKDCFNLLYSSYLDEASRFMLFLAHCSEKSWKRQSFKATWNACFLGYTKVIAFIFEQGYQDPDAFAGLLAGEHVDLVKIYDMFEQRHYEEAAGFAGKWGICYVPVHRDTKYYAKGLFGKDRSCKEIYEIGFDLDFSIQHWAQYYGRLDILQYNSNTTNNYIYCFDNLECMKYLVSVGTPWENDVFFCRLKRTTVEILEFAFTHGWNPNISYLKRKLNGECLEWLEKKIL